jgi:hypothetical protein
MKSSIEKDSPKNFESAKIDITDEVTRGGVGIIKNLKLRGTGVSGVWMGLYRKALIGMTVLSDGCQSRADVVDIASGEIPNKLRDGVETKIIQATAVKAFDSGKTFERSQWRDGAIGEKSIDRRPQSSHIFFLRGGPRKKKKLAGSSVLSLWVRTECAQAT